MKPDQTKQNAMPFPQELCDGIWGPLHGFLVTECPLLDCSQPDAVPKIAQVCASFDASSPEGKRPSTVAMRLMVTIQVAVVRSERPRSLVRSALPLVVDRSRCDQMHVAARREVRDAVEAHRTLAQRVLMYGSAGII